MASEFWVGAGVCEEGGPFHKRAVLFLEHVKWETLLRICSQRRGGIPCQIKDNFSIDHFNLVRHVVFDDGIERIARVRVPDSPDVFEGRELLDVQSVMESEVASMNYLE